MTGFLYGNNSRFSAKNTSLYLKKPHLNAELRRIPSLLPALSAFASVPAPAPSCDGEDRLFKRLSGFIFGRRVVVACVGTDLVGGDCLGPVVGQLLTESAAPAYIYGTLKRPVTALNIAETREFIRIRHPDCLVIAVDCAVGLKREEGVITVSDAPLRPGLALGKQLGAFGDISVTAVTSSHSPDKREFSCVRLGFVYTLARRVAGLILSCLAAQPL